MDRSAKKKIVAISLAITIFLIALKVFVAYLTQSIGVFSEVLNNSLDFVSVLITFLAIRMAVRPADKDHTYGHGKYENLSALIEVIIIAILCFYIIYESVKRIIQKRTLPQVEWYIYVILAVAVFINIVRAIYIGKAARRYGSIALRSNFINYSGDVFSSLIVIAGLALSNYGIHIADPIASIIVSLIVLGFGLRLGLSTVRDLLDYIPGSVTEKVNELVYSVTQVKKIDELKIHEVGNMKFINIVISLPENITLTQAEAIKEKIRHRIKKEFSESRLLIEARLLEKDRTLIERIREVFLAISGIKDIHNLKVYRIGDEIDISIHIEFTEKLNLKESEKLTHKAEKDLKNSIPEIRRIFVHLEEEKCQEDWKDVTGDSTRLISEIKKVLPEEIDQDSCHYITVLERNGLLNIAFHCRFDSSLSVKESHKITTETEETIKGHFKNINEVSIHAEPQ